MAFRLDNITKTEKKIEEKEVSTSFLQKEITFFGSTFSNKIKEDFYAELSVLIKAGITLKDALELVGNSQKKKSNKQLLEEISKDIVSGLSLSESIKQKEQFSEYEYYSIKIGEETGTLQLVAEQLGAFFARKNDQRRNLVSALTYPSIILTTATLVVAFMLYYVVPMFQDIFEQQNVDLPPITEFIISISQFIKSYGWLLIIVIIGVIFSRTFFNKKKWFKKFKDKLILKIPFIGDFVKTVYLSQFTQAIALLTAAKVPVVNSIQLVKQMIDFYPLQNALEVVELSILQGHSLSKSLSEHKLFEDKMIALVKVAEETNQNEFIFERLNNQYNTQVQQALFESIEREQAKRGTL